MISYWVSLGSVRRKGLIITVEAYSTHTKQRQEQAHTQVLKVYQAYRSNYGV